MKKKIIFILIVFLIFFFILNFFSKIYLIKKYPNNNNKFTKETLNLYSKHINQLHHLRDPFVFPSSEILYSTFGEGDQVLIQGDSWVERFSSSGDTKKVIEKFAKKNNLEIIVSGTSSYSSSLYQAQLYVLNNSYNIDPKILITFFDHTDVGDELCRYKKNRYYDNEKIFVSAYQDFTQGEQYYMNYTLDKVNILSSKKISLIKHILLINIEIKERFFSDFENGCKWKNIMSPITETLNIKDKIYFDKIINEYFEYIFKHTNVKKMIIVTHPHKQHLTGEYKTSISDYLKEIYDKSIYKNQITFFNFKNDFVLNKLNNTDKYCVFVPNDEASHLCDVYQYKVLVPIILNEAYKINKYID